MFSLMEYVYIFAFLLNLIWEYGHLPLYECINRWDRVQKIFFPFLASVGDAVIVLGILYGAGWVSGAVGVGLGTGIFWTVHLLIGFFVAVLLEWLAIRFKMWEYKSSMPAIRVARRTLGISPVLQITLTPVLALYLGLLLI